MDTRLVKTGYLQYGWITNGAAIHKAGDEAICMYKYSPDAGGSITFPEI